MPIHRPVYLLCMHLPNTVLMCACRPFLSHASSRRMGSLLPLSLFLVLFRKTPVLREFNSIICRLPVVGGMVDPKHIMHALEYIVPIEYAHCIPATTAIALMHSVARL